MPLYEYKCKQCGHRFEVIQSFSAEDVKECPVCHGEVERLISTPARAHFKGSGFYSTDYGSKSGGGSSESSAPAKTESATPAAAPAAATPSTKSE